MKNQSAIGTATVVGALVAFGAFATAAILFVQGDASTERLALLFGLFGVVIPALIASLRADQASYFQQNGGMDRKIAEGVQVALKSRRASDPLPASKDELANRLINPDPLVPPEGD